MTTDALVPDTVATPVPEPGTLLLVGTGLAGAGAWSRTRWFGAEVRVDGRPLIGKLTGRVRGRPAHALLCRWRVTPPPPNWRRRSRSGGPSPGRCSTARSEAIPASDQHPVRAGSAAPQRRRDVLRGRRRADD